MLPMVPRESITVTKGPKNSLKFRYHVKISLEYSEISFKHFIIRILTINRPKFTFSTVLGHFRSILSQFRGGIEHYDILMYSLSVI